MGAPGCDDAPLVEIKIGSTPKDVTFVYPYYENPGFLRRQWVAWSAYPDDLRRHLSVIVVDDGSPVPAVFPEIRAIHARLFRIEVDVRWNWLAARNVGMNHGASGWRVMTDMDHVVPEATLRTLVYGIHDPGVIYRFSRVGTKLHPHPNSWFMTQDMFWKIGGYDESCSGYYGTDGDYRRRCAAAAPVKIMTCPLEHHEHEGDSSTVRYQRKQREDARVKQIIRSRPRDGTWRPRVLSFPYHEVVT